MDAIEQAVAIYRRLAEQAPARFEPDLASSLNNLSNRQFETGKVSAAQATINEAIELIRPYAEKYPQSTFGRWYGMMQSNRDRYRASRTDPGNSL